MKKQMIAIVATFSLLVVLTALGIAANLSGFVTTRIPFDFTVNGKTLPAGKYDVTIGTTPGMLIIRNAESRQAVVVITQTADDKMDEKARLVFHRYGKEHFLASISDGNKTRELPKTKAERKAARGDYLAMDVKPEIVSVAATAGQ
jgi:hypothetical protein